MKKIISASLLLISFVNAHALETDNYLMWKRELIDSTPKINQLLASEIQNTLYTLNSKTKIQECKTVTKEIASRFMSYFVDKNPLENWLKENLGLNEIYPGSGDYVSASIYRDPFRFYVPAFGLSPNVQVNNIYFGTDKLTHFSSTGRRYLNHYLDEIEDGLTDVEARESAILFGIKNEISILGYWSSGVFSYGDIEANYQGFLFYKKMCMEGAQSYLRQDSLGKWHMIEKPDIRNYASPYWDETYNLSYRLPANWTKVSIVLKEQYCPLATDPLVVARMNYYRQFPHNSFSLDFIRKLQSEEYTDTPDPETSQSFAKLCGY